MKQTGQVSSGGAGPAYISVDASGHSAFVANYFGSSIASYRIQPDGTLSQPVDRIDFKDHQKFGALGPASARQDIPHPHSATISPDNRFLLVCDLGTDHINVFLIHPETGQLSEPAYLYERPPRLRTRVTSSFIPTAAGSTASTKSTPPSITISGPLRASPTPLEGLLVNTNTPVKTIAANFRADKNTAAELAISSDGLFLYASNRGEDSLVVFSIEPKHGKLDFVQRISCGGKTPRHFTHRPHQPVDSLRQSGLGDDYHLPARHCNGKTQRSDPDGSARFAALHALCIVVRCQFFGSVAISITKRYFTSAFTTRS